MSSFAIKKIILQREEKIYKLKRILEKTISINVEKSVILQIKDQKKELEYFENLKDKQQTGMEIFLQ